MKTISIRRLYKSGVSGKEYPTIRLPKELADKYSLNQPCMVEIIDCEELNGILIKKAS